MITKSLNSLMEFHKIASWNCHLDDEVGQIVSGKLSIVLHSQRIHGKN